MTTQTKWETCSNADGQWDIVDEGCGDMVCDLSGCGTSEVQEVRANLIAAAPELADWLKRHYADEEGIGETDRPMYIELRALLARLGAV